jgi:hypothetical protein
LILTGFHDSRPRDPEYPVVCLDETSKQLIAETRVPIPAKPGRPARIDYEYKRNGTANIFMLFAPLEGWRHVEVTDRHTAVDYAHLLKQVSDGERVHIPSISILPIPGVPDTRLDRPQVTKQSRWRHRAAFSSKACWQSSRLDFQPCGEKPKV